MTTRITEIEENYDADGQSISVVFGKSELTIAQKIRSDMSEVKTALSASTGISEVAEALNLVEETLGDLTEVDPAFNLTVQPTRHPFHSLNLPELAI